MHRTMEMAWSLGKVYQIEKPTILSPSCNSVKWYFVLDFESTCDVKPRSCSHPEIIEFPVVLFNASTGQVVDEFQRFVKPTENGVLSQFCRKLTGISQDVVNNASDLEHVLQEFESWFAVKQSSLNCEFKFYSENSAVFATWTDWDICTCLWDECQRKQLNLPTYFLNRIDLKAVFKQWIASNSGGEHMSWRGTLEDALKAVGLSFQGRPHRGIDDARNTVALLKHMLKNQTKSI